MSTLTTNAILDAPRLAPGRAAQLQRAGLVVGILGGVVCLGAALVDLHRFAFAYLVGFAFVTTVALGAQFFVQLQYLTRAGWSVGPRRHMEWMASALPLALALFVPLALLASTVWGAWMRPSPELLEVVDRKHAYLNPVFFYVRQAVYFAVWIGLARYFARGSSLQDQTGDPALTRRMQWMSAPAMLLYAVTVTFAGFDWLMSLAPAWYSTIFGVYVFAGGLVAALAALALVTLALQRTGTLKVVSTVEHRHDIGKLLFGFTIFYAYISFSQYFLIWYANIPEETIFYRERWVGGWQALSLTLVFAHFVIPFALLLSRAGKRSPLVLGTAALVLLFAHWLDLYWLVMPHASEGGGVHFSWVDIAASLGPLGLFAWWLSMRVARDRLYPVRDPRLHEAVRLENP